MEKLPKDAQDEALLPGAASSTACWVRCQEVPPQTKSPTSLLRSSGEQNVSPGCPWTAEFPLLLRPTFVHEAKKTMLREKEPDREMQPERNVSL